jgi:predicted RNase H-like HicB family nuclease
MNEDLPLKRLRIIDTDVPYTVEQDEDGVWCAHAQIRPGVGANGDGDTREEAVADLRVALGGLVAEFGATAPDDTE